MRISLRGVHSTQQKGPVPLKPLTPKSAPSASTLALSMMTAKLWVSW